MKKLVSILILLATIHLSGCVCQKDLSFSYEGKNISPEALINFFPSLADGSKLTKVDLSKGVFTIPVVIDASDQKPTKGDWYRCNLNTTDIIDYKIIGTTNKCKVVVLSRYTTNTVTQIEVFVLNLKKTKLSVIGDFLPSNIRDYPVVIQGDKIVNGPTSYKIP